MICDEATSVYLCMSKYAINDTTFQQDKFFANRVNTKFGRQ